MGSKIYPEVMRTLGPSSTTLVQSSWSLLLMALRTESHQKSTDAAIKNLEVQIGQLAKLVAERPTETFGVNTKMKPK
ncbi:hypothetical protein GmHk_12G035119 [Glycine max]|nr:hypothetical protein GmHk_12G035119 [Glycine max]